MLTVLKQYLKGVLSYSPTLGKVIGWGGVLAPSSARYCYSVWMRHLVLAGERGFRPPFEVVAELGPGDSLGLGLVALLTGAQQYYAFDLQPHAFQVKNVQILDELVILLRRRSPIPDDREFPEVIPRLSNYAFPHTICTETILSAALAPERIEWIRRLILGNPPTEEQQSPRITYQAPWDGVEQVQPGTVDLIISQAVLEHVDDLEKAYKTMYLWLKPQGLMSHTIDFKSHGTSSKWNGHWSYSDFSWKIIRGKRAFLLNREPYSTHRRLIQRGGFKLSSEIKTSQPRYSGISHKQLAKRFRNLSEEDRVTVEAFIQATKE